ncbi:MAG: hypothetical protein AAGB19_21025 [Cyanobacteria bacterium P01_F01_bin.3]
MRARVDNGVLFIRNEDTPPYKKNGPIVRNSYFWALKSIADRAPFSKDWEFEERVWIALARMLTSFAESGYLGLRETQLEFHPNDEIPPELKVMATWRDPSEEEEEDKSDKPWPYN